MLISQHAAVQTGTKNLSEKISIKQPAAAPAGPKTLIVYDAPAGSQFSKLGMIFGIMLKNLMGHFDSNAELLPVNQYVAGQMQAYDATFYLGSYYGNPLPAAFLSDVSKTHKTVVVQLQPDAARLECRVRLSG